MILDVISPALCAFSLGKMTILKPITDTYTEITETLLVRLAEATAPRNQGCGTHWYPLQIVLSDHRS